MDDLAKLELLQLDNNQLTGQIPRELGNLAKLKTLRLGYNQLTGQIPRELGNLAKLRELSLSNNRLTGQIPRELGGLVNLYRVYLSGNDGLTGCIPAEWQRMAYNDFGLYGLPPFCPIEAPTVTGDAAVSYPENDTTVVATYAATDPEGVAIYYHVWAVGGDDADLFTIDRGRLRFRNPPDYEAPADADGDNMYAVTVTASTASGSSTVDVTVTVTNVEEPGTVTLSTYHPQLDFAQNSDEATDAITLASRHS